MRKKEEEYTRELTLKEQKRKELYAKQGRYVIVQLNIFYII